MENLTIENAKFGIRCFGGNDRYNPGKRYVFVKLPEDVAYALREDGWNVKVQVAADDYEAFARFQRDGWTVKMGKLEKSRMPDPEYSLQVNFSYDKFPPRIFMIADGQKTPLDENTVCLLDNAEIESADMIVHPRKWETATKSGIKAYLKTMYVTIVTDELDRKYANVRTAILEPHPGWTPKELDDDETVPF